MTSRLGPPLTARSLHYTTLFRSHVHDLGNLAPDRGAVFALHLERVRDVLRGGAARQELEVLEHAADVAAEQRHLDRKSTRLNSSHLGISYAVFCLKKKKTAHALR